MVLPARSLMPVAPPLMVAVYAVLGNKLVCGTNTASTPEMLAVPVTAALLSFCLTVKLVVVTVAGSMASLKEIPTLALVATAVALLALTLLLTVGALVSVPAAVLKVHEKPFARPKPALSLAVVVTVA